MAKKMIFKFISKYADQIFPVSLIIALFFNLAYISPQIKQSLSSISTIFITLIINTILIISSYYLVKNKSIIINLSKSLPWIPILTYLLIRLLFFDSIPRWDSSEYFHALISTIKNFDFTFRYIVDNFNWFGHLSLGFSFITSIGQMFDPANTLTLNITNTLIGIVGVFSFYKIIEYLFENKGKTENILLSMLLATNPLYVGVSLGYFPDFSVLVFFLIFLASFLYRKYLLTIFFSILLVFSKETGALVYGAFTLFYFIFNIKQLHLKDKLKNIFTLLIPLFLLLLYFIYKKWQFWAPDGTSFLSTEQGCRFCFGIIPFNIFQNIGVYFILNFNWILSLTILTGLISSIFSKENIYSFIKRNDSKTYLKILNICLLSLISFFMVFVIYVMPRYATLGIPLLILLFYTYFRNLFINQLVRKRLLFFIVILFTIQIFFTIDPISKHFFGTYKLGNHKILKVGTEFMGDGFIYNTQHVYPDRILKKFIHNYQITSMDNIYIEPYAWGEFYSEWGHFVGQDPLIYFSLENIGTLPDNAYYLSFPFRRYTPEEKTKIQNAYVAPFENPNEILINLEKIYRISNLERIDINGYWVDVYKLSKK